MPGYGMGDDFADLNDEVEKLKAENAKLKKKLKTRRTIDSTLRSRVTARKKIESLIWRSIQSLDAGGEIVLSELAETIMEVATKK